jgi:hypothetical protein
MRNHTHASNTCVNMHKGVPTHTRGTTHTGGTKHTWATTHAWARTHIVLNDAVYNMSHASCRIRNKETRLEIIANIDPEYPLRSLSGLSVQSSRSTTASLPSPSNAKRKQLGWPGSSATTPIRPVRFPFTGAGSAQHGPHCAASRLQTGSMRASAASATTASLGGLKVACAIGNSLSIVNSE